MKLKENEGEKRNNQNEQRESTEGRKTNTLPSVHSTHTPTAKRLIALLWFGKILR